MRRNFRGGVLKLMLVGYPNYSRRWQRRGYRAEAHSTHTRILCPSSTPIWPGVSVATSFNASRIINSYILPPQTSTHGDRYFEAFKSSFVPITTNLTIQETTIRSRSCTLLSVIGPAFTIYH